MWQTVKHPIQETTEKTFWKQRITKTILKKFSQKIWKFEKEMHVMFIDFKKKYDCIHKKNPFEYNKTVQIIPEVYKSNKSNKLSLEN